MIAKVSGCPRGLEVASWVGVMMKRFYKPKFARFGDTIPFFWDGRFHVFYLKRYADDTHDTAETAWWHVVTDNFVDFEDWGEAISRGDHQAADDSIATGSVLRLGDRFVAYYTGYSGWQKRNGGREQTILRAFSDDLREWRKDQSFSMNSDPDLYDLHDWRDPFVFWDPERGVYRMLISARLSVGTPSRTGVTAQAVSPDGLNWTPAEPFWSPGLHFMHECVDVFEMNGRWYQVYSTIEDRQVTRYRVADTLDGPWWAPADNELDGRGLYAGKTVSDGKARYLVGWVPNRVGGRDDADWLWGGNMVVHQLAGRPDGTLEVLQPGLVRQALNEEFGPGVDLTSVTVAAPAGYGSAPVCDMGGRGYIEMDIEWEPGTKAVGLELWVNAERSIGYSLVLEPDLCRARVDYLGRTGATMPTDIRPLFLKGSRAKLTIDVSGEVAAVYLDGTAFTIRGANPGGTGLALFCAEGSVELTKGRAIMSTRPATDI